MGTIASLITSLASVYSTVHSGADQRKHQSSVSLAFVRGIHRRLVNSLHKWPVMRKMFPFDDFIMVGKNSWVGRMVSSVWRLLWPLIISCMRILRLMMWRTVQYVVVGSVFIHKLWLHIAGSCFGQSAVLPNRNTNSLLLVYMILWSTEVYASENIVTAE